MPTIVEIKEQKIDMDNLSMEDLKRLIELLQIVNAEYTIVRKVSNSRTTNSTNYGYIMRRENNAKT